MKVVYTAPNRAHHYRYALALQNAGCLQAFVSGFPRLNARAKLPELNGKLHRADILQTFYIASLKANFPRSVSNWLAFLSKIEQDVDCRKFVKKNCDIFLFYNGSGLTTSRYAKRNGVINVVEAVNTHVEYQEEILEKEHRNLRLQWKPFHKAEKNRRLKEYEEADFILIASEFVKQSFLQKGFPPAKLLKVPYGFNKSNVSKPPYDSTNKTFTVLYVGSISIRKGLRYLIEAFKQLKHSKKRLMLVGSNANDGALNGIVLTPDILFTGILKGDDLIEAYRSADVFCLPSIEDGFGLVLGEALSVGLPIIATENTGALDLITDGVEGFIVPIKDSNAILEKLQILADDPELQSTLKMNSYQRAEKLNGWEESSQLLVETLQAINTNPRL